MTALANMATQLARRPRPQPRDNRIDADSTTGKLRIYLRDKGDADAEMLRAAMGLESTRLVWGLLKADMQCGRVTRIGNNFHLASDEERRAQDPELHAAIELLASRGYRAVKRGKRHA